MCKNSDLTARPSIDDLPEKRFVEGWTAIVGEPPSIMLDRHREMIVVLVRTVPADPEDGPMRDQQVRPHPEGWERLARPRPGPQARTRDAGRPSSD